MFATTRIKNNFMGSYIMSINGKKVFTEADVIAALRLAKANKVTD